MKSTQDFCEGDTIRDTMGMRGRVTKINHRYNRVYVILDEGDCMDYAPDELTLLYRSDEADGVGFNIDEE